ncbi:7391_t:CDS:1, partial [Acaulospora morrowiae]
MRPSTYICAQPQQAAALNVSRSIYPEEITNSVNANRQASPPPSQQGYLPSSSNIIITAYGSNNVITSSNTIPITSCSSNNT